MCAKKKSDENFNFEEKIVDTALSKAIHNYMIPYSEYVILDRALPRVEDGLKPVQRRVLYTMYEMGLKPEGETKKSARIVGNCMGQYHPHGDSSIYNAMVVLAQNFKTRNSLVYGQGNFGSVDGDGAAAMRYTEAKLEPLGYELMRDIDKDTIPWSRNYDDSQDEPEILPGRFPNLLVNGCPIGIAVGLTTKIPPHNLSEVIDGVIAYINNPNISTKELMNYIKGPDFPTGGFIENTNLLSMYETGEGKFVISAKYDIEIADNDKQNIVITELPYDVNKAKLCQEIKDIRDSLREKTGKDNILAGITEISDESNKNGIRIVIRLKKGENATEIVKFLFAKTKLKISYNAIFVAVVGGKPEQLCLNNMIKHYVNHQRNIILNSHKFDCNKAKKRAHILEGFMIVHPDIREVCDIVIESKTESEAKSRLKARFSISEAQTEAILSTKLRSLTKMEITKLEKELAELKRQIAECERIINSKTAQMEYLKKDLLDMKNTYRVKRQTTIVGSIDSTFVDPLSIGEKDGRAGFVAIYANDKVGFVNARQYHNARKSASLNGVDGLTKSVTEVAPGDTVLLFTNFGNCIKLKTDLLEEKRWAEDGQELKQICSDVSEGERPVNVIAIPSDDDGDAEIFFFTKNGQGKRGKLSDYDVNKEIYQAMILKEDDEVVSVERRRDETGFAIVSKRGMYVNLNPDDFSPTGRKSGGVGAISLSSDDKVIFASQAEEEEDIDGRHPIGEVLLITTDGLAKRLIMDYIGKSKRNVKGDRIITFADETSFVRSAFIVTMSYDLAITDYDKKVYIVNTEDVMVENKKSKGRAIECKAVSLAEKDVSDT